MVRIDYVWRSEHFVATDVSVWEKGDPSDHYLLTVRLVLMNVQDR
jgi:endonuclease/exonuclease/phosphatase family metal-dependent hydrolase